MNRDSEGPAQASATKHALQAWPAPSLPPGTPNTRVLSGKTFCDRGVSLPGSPKKLGLRSNTSNSARRSRTAVLSNAILLLLFLVLPGILGSLFDFGVNGSAEPA